MTDLPMGPRAEIPIELGGRTYVATKLNIFALIELERWMRKVPLDLLADALKGATLPAAHVETMMREAWYHAQDMLVFSAKGAFFCARSIEGLMRVLWLGLKAKNPTLTFEQVCEWADRLKADPDLKTDDSYHRIAIELLGGAEQNPTKPPAKGENSTSESSAVTS